MKEINELTQTECQSILDELFKNSKTKFENFIKHEEKILGIEYSIIYETKAKSKIYKIPINDPDLVTELYKIGYNISEPLKYLKLEYFEMDEINCIFIDHITTIGDVLNDMKLTSDQKIDKIKEVRKYLAEKI